MRLAGKTGRYFENSSRKGQGVCQQAGKKLENGKQVAKRLAVQRWHVTQNRVTKLQTPQLKLKKLNNKRARTFCNTQKKRLRRLSLRFSRGLVHNSIAKRILRRAILPASLMQLGDLAKAWQKKKAVRSPDM